jgi:hypothetical protein
LRRTASRESCRLKWVRTICSQWIWPFAKTTHTNIYLKTQMKIFDCTHWNLPRLKDLSTCILTFSFSLKKYSRHRIGFDYRLERFFFCIFFFSRISLSIRIRDVGR